MKHISKKIEIEILKEGGNFLKHQTLKVTHYNEKFECYRYEVVRRRGEDCVGVAIFTRNGDEYLFGLKKVFRIPKVARRLVTRRGIFDIKESYLLEIVAGSLEEDEKSVSAIKKRVKEEVYEEGGFEVNEKSIVSLGKPFFTSPGQSTEKIYPFAVCVDTKNKVKEIGDGSIIEKESSPLIFYPQEKILYLIRNGMIEDAKSEIILSRLFFKLNLL